MVQTETPDLFEKLIKGRIDYTWDETGSKNVTFSLAKPTNIYWTVRPEGDTQFGGARNVIPLKELT